MPKYNETSLVGESWRRVNQIIIENRYNMIPNIRFFEEDVFISSNNNVIINSNVSRGVEEQFTNENSLTRFQLKNPQTEEYIDSYATYQDLYVLLHSLYFHLAKIRDKGPAPYVSWIYNKETYQWEAPIPKPDEINEYNWDEDTQSWILVE